MGCGDGCELLGEPGEAVLRRDVTEVRAGVLRRARTDVHDAPVRLCAHGAERGARRPEVRNEVEQHGLFEALVVAIERVVAMAHRSADVVHEDVDASMGVDGSVDGKACALLVERICDDALPRTHLCHDLVEVGLRT